MKTKLWIQFWVLLGCFYMISPLDVSAADISQQSAYDEYLRLKNLKTQDPAAYRLAINEKKRALKQDLEVIKQDNARYQEFLEKNEVRRRDRLEWIQNHDPEQYQNFAQQRVRKLEQIKQSEPEKYRRITSGHPELEKRMELMKERFAKESAFKRQPDKKNNQTFAQKLAENSAIASKEIKKNGNEPSLADGNRSAQVEESFNRPRQVRDQNSIDKPFRDVAKEKKVSAQRLMQKPSDSNEPGQAKEMNRTGVNNSLQQTVRAPRGGGIEAGRAAEKWQPPQKPQGGNPNRSAAKRRRS